MITVQDVFRESYKRSGKVPVHNLLNNLHDVRYLKSADGFMITGELNKKVTEIFIPVSDMQYIIQRLVEIDDV